MHMPDTAALIYAGAALGGAAAVHALYRASEALERRGILRTRDLAMVPGLVILACGIAWLVDWIETHHLRLLVGTGFAIFLGMRIGQIMPRPPRRRRQSRMRPGGSP